MSLVVDHVAAPAAGRSGGEEDAPLELVRLTSLMSLTAGRPEVLVGILDGPVDWHRPALRHARVRHLAPDRERCEGADGSASAHATFVAGILAASRESQAPAICPECTFLARPIVDDVARRQDGRATITIGSLAQAIVDCVMAGANVLNLSAATGQPTIRLDRSLQDALDLAATRGVVVIAAAGNQGTLGTSTITRHPWVLPVIACDAAGQPMSQSNLGMSLGRRGVAAPGSVMSLGPDDAPMTIAGTSFAAPIVTATIALLWSLYPGAPAAVVRDVVIHAGGARRRSVVPPLLDAHAALVDLAARIRNRIVPQEGGLGRA